MSRATVTLIDMYDGTVAIFCNYADKDRVKALPTARWDPENKCWRVSVMLIREARRLVAELNDNGPTMAAQPATSDLAATLTRLFNLLPQSLRATTYRALAKVLHPDAGGDEAVTKALTAAWASIR